MERKQDLKKKKQRLKKQQDFQGQEPEVRLKLRKPQQKTNKYKNNKQYWLAEEE